MKQLFLMCSFLAGCAGAAFGQLSVYDCQAGNSTVTQSEIDATTDYYKQCIHFDESQGYLFDQTDLNDVRALAEIRMSEGFHAGQYTGNGKMHLKLDEKSPLDVFLMNNDFNLSNVPLFGKLELGLDLPLSIDQMVNEFFTAQNPSANAVNPFDPEDLNISAEFQWFYNGNWYPAQQRFGFYYEEFIPFGNAWENQNTLQNYRIRFAPKAVGKWRCSIRVAVHGTTVLQSKPFLFNVTNTGLKDFVRVGANKRYLKIGNDPFFPVGQNLPWPDYANGWYPGTSLPDTYEQFREDMEVLADAGANYMRLLFYPKNFEIEWEKLGNYKNRMSNAWEIDRTVDKAKELGLRLHFNMQVHTPYEQTSPYTVIQYDYSKAGDPVYNQTGCGSSVDIGNPYRRELNLPTPKDFLKSADAKKYYKMRLRYIISRWGYSTAIAVIELLSEINNVGQIQAYNSNCGPASTLAYPYKDDPEMPSLVSQWQNEMFAYIKHTLGHKDQLTCNSYTGNPNTFYDMPGFTVDGANLQRGDLSYFSPDLDVWSWNFYSSSPERFATLQSLKERLIPNNSIPASGSTYGTISVPNPSAYLMIDKPMIFSETGNSYGRCDNNISWRQEVLICPFLGGTGGIPWTMNNDNIGDPAWVAERNELWTLCGRVKDYIEGIPLDDENWIYDQDERKDKKADMFCLKTQSGKKRAIGAVQNRTVNSFTARDVSVDFNSNGGNSQCFILGQGNNLDLVYKIAQNVNYGTGNNYLHIHNMDFLTTYIVEWYDPMNDVYLGSQEVTSDVAFRLPLLYPTLLSTIDRSVLYFKVRRKGEPAFSTVVSNTQQAADEVPEYIFEQFEQSSEHSTTLSETSRKNMNRGQLTIAPNPGTDKFVIAFTGSTGSLTLTNDLGVVVYQSEEFSSGSTLELGNFSKGVYFVVVQTSEGEFREKLIKL